MSLPLQSLITSLLSTDDCSSACYFLLILSPFIEGAFTTACSLSKNTNKETTDEGEWEKHLILSLALTDDSFWPTTPQQIALQAAAELFTHISHALELLRLYTHSHLLLLLYTLQLHFLHRYSSAKLQLHSLSSSSFIVCSLSSLSDDSDLTITSRVI